MKAATIVGILLILLGVAGFAMGGFSFKEHKKDVDLGPVEIGHEEKHGVAIPPVLSGIALIGGIGLVVVGAKSRTA